MLHEAISTPKGDKRGAAFGRARLNLSKYASATVGKRVVLTLAAEGPACAGGDKARAITAVVTVAAEPSDKTPTGSSNALDEVGASAAKADLDGASQRVRRASHHGCVCMDLYEQDFRSSVHRLTPHARCWTDDGDDEDSAHASAPGALALPVFDCGGSSEDEDGAPMTPHAHVAPAAGAKSKPLPAPPAPAQLAPRAVEWRGVGAGTVAETQRLFAACCPCFAPRVESFEPLR